MADALRVGVAGAGFIGRVHVQSARRAGGDVVAIAASTLQRSEAAARELGIAIAASSVEELLSAELDVLHVATPNDLHVPYALAAVEAGVHVVLEKPIARSSVELQALLDAARRAGVAVTVPFVYRFYPTVRHARELVRTGAIGDLRLLHGHYLQDWLAHPSDTNWRVDEAKGGPSRTFADIGSHWCDLVQFVTGARIARVMARTSTVVNSRSTVSRESFSQSTRDEETAPVRTEDLATLLFETSTGVLGTLAVSQVSHGRKNRLWFEVDGSDSAIAFDQEDPERLWVGEPGGSRTIVRDPGSLAPAAARYATLPAGHPQGYADCFDAFVADSHAAMRGEHRDGLPLLADGAAAVALTDAVVRSARTQTWIDVEDV